MPRRSAPGWSLLVLVAALLAIVAPARAEKVALVIGVSTYEHVPALTNPKNDAEDVAARFRDIGYSVDLVLDPDFSALRTALLDFKARAAGAEVAVIYYAGHGIEIGSENFLIPRDARLATDTDVAFEAVPLRSALLAVDGARELSLVIVDACRNNPFAARMTRSGDTRSIGRGLGRIEPAGNTLVAYAAREGTVAADGDGRNSPYAAALLEHMDGEGVEIGLMFRRIRDRVIELTSGQQEPFLYGSLSAEPFFFLPPAASPREETAVAPPRDDGNRVELLFWESVRNSRDRADFDAYLQQFPDGAYASLARNRLAALAAAPAAAAPAGPATLAPDPSGAERQLGLGRADWTGVQQALAALGYAPRGIDGVPGPGTRTAIAAWQADRGHDATGHIDDAQLGQLGAEAGPKLAALAAERARLAALDPISGSWTGSVTYDGNAGAPFTFNLRLEKTDARVSGRMFEPNTFADAPVSHLFADIAGTFSAGSLEFTKTYDGTGGQTHSVQYRGRLARDGRIEGTWSVGGTTGTFEMTRQ